MGKFYFTLDPREMSWAAFKGYWGEKAKETCESVENCANAIGKEFTSEGYYAEKFKGTESVGDALLRVGSVYKDSGKIAVDAFDTAADALTEKLKDDRFDTFIECNPRRWTKDSFSVDRYSDFMNERLETSPIYRYGINLATSNAKPITSLGMEKRAGVKFAFDATWNAIHGETVSEEYSRLEHTKDDNTGYEVFVQCSDNNKIVVISYKDTDDKKDVLYSDIPMAFGHYPAQLPQALATYKKIAEEYPNYKIVVSGLSLGGSLSELVASSPLAAKHGKTVGYSFNGYGVAGPVLKSCGEGFEDRGNVTAISAKADRIVGRAAKHVGEEYIVDSGIESLRDFLSFHHISFMDNEMESMQKDEDLYKLLLHPRIDIGSTIVKHP